MGNEKVRYNLYLSKNIAEKFDEFADENGLNRSAAFTIMIREYLSYKAFLESFPHMINVLGGEKKESQ